jgi:hypothetical protein
MADNYCAINASLKWSNQCLRQWQGASADLREGLFNYPKWIGDTCHLGNQADGGLQAADILKSNLVGGRFYVH